jgi:hypothetical protein
MPGQANFIKKRGLFSSQFREVHRHSALISALVKALLAVSHHGRIVITTQNRKTEKC